MDIKKLFVTHCSPTFSGLKPSNLFSISTKDINDNIFELRETIKQIKISGLDVRIMCSCKNRVLFLVYNTYLLEKSLDSEKLTFLHIYGYPKGYDIEKYLDILSQRLKFKSEFPHEIGIFLGIPLLDILGYIANKGKNFIYCDYWKVYSDYEICLQVFSKFRNSLINNIEKINNGANISEIITIA